MKPANPRILTITGASSSIKFALYEVGGPLERIVLMCSEAVPWRCHRWLIADALPVRGIRTEDIVSPTRPQVQTLTPFAKVRATTITYSAEDSQST